MMEEKKWVRNSEDWKIDEIITLNSHRLITAKKVVYLVNLSEEDFLSKKNKWLKKIK